MDARAYLMRKYLSPYLPGREAATVDVDVIAVLQQVGLVERESRIHDTRRLGVPRGKWEDDACRDTRRGRSVYVRQDLRSRQGADVADRVTKRLRCRVEGEDTVSDRGASVGGCLLRTVDCDHEALDARRRQRRRRDDRQPREYGYETRFECMHSHRWSPCVLGASLHRLSRLPPPVVNTKRTTASMCAPTRGKAVPSTACRCCGRYARRMREVERADAGVSVRSGMSRSTA